MINIFTVIDILYSMIAVSSFLLPLCAIYSRKMKVRDRIVLWLLPLFLYRIYTGFIFPEFSGSTVFVVSSIEIISLITLLATSLWYIFKNIQIHIFWETMLVIHLEVIILSWGLWKMNFTIIHSYSLYMELFIAFAVLLIQVLFVHINKKLLNFCHQKTGGVIFRLIAGILLLVIYFYQLIYFFTNESIEIIYEGAGNSAAAGDALSLFMRLLLAFLVVFTISALLISRYHLLSTRLKERALREQELENYIAAMEVLQTDIRKIHHDYKNLITALGGYLYDDDKQVNIQGLKDYYNKNVLVQKETELKTINLSKLQNLKLLEVKGLLAAKLIQASQQSIKVSIEIQDMIEDFPMDKLDLTRVIGNLLDNAIEEAVKCSEPEIHIAFIYDKDITIFVVENTTTYSDLPVSSLSEAGVSTKGAGRGLGLNNIADILAGYANVFQETQLQEGYFQQKIVFMDEHI